MPKMEDAGCSRYSTDTHTIGNPLHWRSSTMAQMLSGASRWKKSKQTLYITTKRCIWELELQVAKWTSFGRFRKQRNRDGICKDLQLERFFEIISLIQNAKRAQLVSDKFSTALESPTYSQAEMCLQYDNHIASMSPGGPEHWRINWKSTYLIVWVHFYYRISTRVCDGELWQPSPQNCRHVTGPILFYEVRSCGLNCAFVTNSGFFAFLRQWRSIDSILSGFEPSAKDIRCGRHHRWDGQQDCPICKFVDVTTQIGQWSSVEDTQAFSHLRRICPCVKLRGRTTPVLLRQY